MQFPIVVVALEWLKTIITSPTVISTYNYLQQSEISGITARSIANISLLLLVPLLIIQSLTLSKIRSFKDLKMAFTGFFKPKLVPWGIVYDSKTKRPLDPVLVTLESEDGKIYQTVTDMYGRYSFLVKPGLYNITLEKSNYFFPSEKIKSQLDELVYPDILTTVIVHVKDKEPIKLNIPMDPQDENFNEVEKARRGYRAPSTFLALIRQTIYFVGFIWSTYGVIVYPTLLNVVLFLIFSLYTLYARRHEKYQEGGYIREKDGKPAVGYIVELTRPTLKKTFSGLGKATFVTDVYGRYSFLVEKGEYKIEVSKMENGQKIKVYESPVIKMKKNIGVISKNIHL